jgi:hypothetical protein
MKSSLGGSIAAVIAMTMLTASPSHALSANTIPDFGLEPNSLGSARGLAGPRSKG